MTYHVATSFHRPTWAEIDLGAVVENYRALRSLIHKGTESALSFHSAVPPRILPVIKANGYGHGSAAIAAALAAEEATCFAVAIVEEGVKLREAGIHQEILVLQGAWPGQERELLRHGLTAAVFSPDAILRLERASREMNRVARVHLKIDTGMARLGAPWNDLAHIVQTFSDTPRVRLAGTLSHLACADEADSEYTREQIRRFGQAIQFLHEAGLQPGEIHLANSVGLLHCPETRQLSARPGLALYGYSPSPERSPVKLRQALTLKTRVGRLHMVQPGSSVGYGRRFTASRLTKAATLPVGYADGYPRALSGTGKVIVHDRLVNVVGAISMDLMVVDVTDIPDVREGDEVILIGSSAHCRVDALDLANLIGTIPYEILCRISTRVERVYKT